MKKVSMCFAGILSLFAALPLSAEEAAPAAREGNMMQTVIMIALALAFFYFILWRPEQKRRKQMDKIRTSLKKGDKVTAMGMIGTVAKVQENTVILSLYEGSAKIEVMKAAITDVQPTAEESKEKVAIEASDIR